MSIEQEPTVERIAPVPDDVTHAALEVLGSVYEVGADGVEYLRGYGLPPNNDDPWRADRTLDEGMCLSNAFVREANIRSIMKHGSPIFMRWDEVELDGLRRDKGNTLMGRVLDLLLVGR